ncbi:hypothetical protein R1flu_007269 [Riccia fluitans]|uniref:YTH domain-containing protein n=1 Tax=Riccia fluitans TaxID=41844 RepID=A0ABD1YYM5_9MARC
MGVKGTSRQSKDSNDASDGVRDPANGEASTSSNRALEKGLASSRRRVENVLDDVMGDPEDFRDFEVSDGESDGGRWEDAVREALDNEEAGTGASHEDVREAEGACSKESHEVSSRKDDEKHELPRKGPSVDPSSSRDAECPGQKAKGLGKKGIDRQPGCELPVHESRICKQQGKAHQTRYFIIKSLNHHNIVKSIENGIWATQAMNEPVLNEAYETSKRVLLIFSVNMSGHFQGYAQMASPIGRRRANVWTEGNEGANPWGGSFRVEWLRLHDLPFQKTVHLKNPLNFFKPVKISRDCQELTQEIGDELCGLIDDGADREGKPKRKVLLADITAHPTKKQRPDTVGMPPDVAFGQAILPGPAGGPHLPYFHSGSASDSFPSTEGLDPVSRSFSNGVRGGPSSRLRVSGSKSPHPTISDQSMDRDRDRDRECRRRQRERPVDSERPRETRSSSSGRSGGDAAVEEDLLNMTYEEYLQRHGRAKDYNGYRQGAGSFAYHQGSPSYGRNWTGKNPRTGSSDDQYSNYIANWYSRQGPAPAGDGFLASWPSTSF